jgi:hypothetical protein
MPAPMIAAHRYRIVTDGVTARRHKNHRREPGGWIEQRQRNFPTHLGRLRCLGDEERWGHAFYAYSSESYRVSMFADGTFYGTPEEAFEMSTEVYIGPTTG